MASDDNHPAKVRARQSRIARWQKRHDRTAAHADDHPLGSGPPNRHGMPRLPPRQRIVSKWPIEDLGVRPKLSKQDWQLRIDGAVDTPLVLDWAGLQRLEAVQERSDFHCVTGWSLLDADWRGVRLADVLALAGPSPEATDLMCFGADEYSTNLPLAEATKPDVLLVHTWEGKPLPAEHGGPVRMITPQLYAWKGAKWVVRIEVMVGDQPGFWEARGYSNTGHPWRDDRYGETVPEGAVLPEEAT